MFENIESLLNSELKKYDICHDKIKNIASNVMTVIDEKNKVNALDPEKILQLVDPNDLKCPITLKYMLDPVIASDGHTYEESAINQWLMSSNISPITGLNVDAKIYPNLLVHNALSVMESNVPFFYMERHQFTLKQWIRYYCKKFNIQLSPQILDQIPDQYNESTKKNCILDQEKENQICFCDRHHWFDSPHGKICQLIKFEDHMNDIDMINTCQMPDREILYRCLRHCLTYTYLGRDYDKKMYFNTDLIKKINKFDLTWRKKIYQRVIDSTSPDDDGLKYFLSLLVTDSDFIDHYLDILTPSIHFKLFDFAGFDEYVGSIKNIKEFEEFEFNQFNYFNPEYHKYILHCLPFDKLIENNKVSEIVLLVEMLYKKYVNESAVMCPYNSSIIHNVYLNIDCPKKMGRILYKLFKLGERYDFNVSKSVYEISTIYDNISKNQKMMQFLSKTFNHVLLFDSDIDSLIMCYFNGHWSSCGFDELFQWMIENNIDINKKYDMTEYYDKFCQDERCDLVTHKTIFGMYLEECHRFKDNMKSRTEEIPEIIQRIDIFIKHDVMIEPQDLKTIANILIHADTNTYGIHLIGWYDYFEKHFDDFSIIKYAMVIYQGIVPKNTLMRIIDSCYDHTHILMDQSESILMGLLKHPLLDIEIFEILTQKYMGHIIHNHLELLLNNPSLNVSLLELLRNRVRFTTNMLKIVGTNQGMESEVAAQVMRYLIQRIE